MTDSITIYSNPQFGDVRTVGEMFVAQDVAQALGYTDTFTMTRRLDEDEKGAQSLRTPGGEQTMVVINESGLYNAILGSKLATAKVFKRWVTSEVLPSIRKHGAYMTPDTVERMIADPDTMIALLQTLKAEQAKRIHAETKVAELAPKGEFYDAVAGSKDAIEIGTLAKVLELPNLGRNNLFKRLRELNILDRDNIPHQEFIDRGYFRVIEQKYTTPNGETHISFKTLVYARGQDWVRKQVATCPST